ncbi:MAG: diguanylate cyclase [Ilumatobacteraceae bacterium]
MTGRNQAHDVTETATLPREHTATAPWSALRLTVALSVTLTVCSAAAMVLADFGGMHAIGDPIPWWTIAVLAAVAELLVVRVEVRRESYSFSLTEVPMVLGALFVAPLPFVGAFLLGRFTALVLKERQRGRRLAVNVSSILAECVILVALVRAMGAPRDVQAPLTWLVMACAVLIAQLVGYLIVATVLHWHGIPVRMSSILGAGLAISPATTALGLITAILLDVAPLATVLLTSVGCFLVASYRSYEQLAARHASLTLLYDFTRLVGGSNDPDAVLEAMLTHSRQLVLAERAEIWLLDGDRMTGHRVDADGLHTGAVPANAHELVAAWFDGTDDVAHVQRTSRVLAGRDQAIIDAFEARECVVAPILESGTLVGVMAAVDRDDGVTEFRSRDVRLFATLAGHAGAALENGRMMDRLRDEARAREHDALHDALTGLPNRVLFARRVRAGFDAAQQTGPNDGPVIGLLDLDGFKLVNDTLGHHWGDEVLVEVARRLVRVVDPSVTVARLGGDEFALFVPSITPSDLTRLAALLRSTIGANFPTAVGEVRVGVSIGFARTHPAERQLDTAVLMRRADAAMYRAKQANHRGDAAGYEIDEGADIDDIDDVDGQVVR